GENYSQGQYYLASFANKIWLSPQGQVDLHGFATNGLYYKTLLPRVEQAVNDAAHFTPFHWVDALLMGKSKRALHILQQLRLEG
ncbi:S49 family peptidase, partial [Salmonella enterica subsp. enterica serovar Anatum]|nr:S49 family peptidase [Salmonella enterica subsp. enterica serovar Anatum]